MNKLAIVFPQVARYLSTIEVNLWVVHFINEQLLIENPNGGGGTYGWRSNNMAEGSMSRNKTWRYMHVLHFFREFVNAFVGWMEYVKEKQVEWKDEQFTPDAKRRLHEAEVGAIYREAQQTGSTRIFGVKATDGWWDLCLLI